MRCTKCRSLLRRISRRAMHAGNAGAEINESVRWRAMRRFVLCTLQGTEQERNGFGLCTEYRCFLSHVMSGARRHAIPLRALIHGAPGKGIVGTEVIVESRHAVEAEHDVVFPRQSFLNEFLETCATRNLGQSAHMHFVNR